MADSTTPDEELMTESPQTCLAPAQPLQPRIVKLTFAPSKVTTPASPIPSPFAHDFLPPQPSSKPTPPPNAPTTQNLFEVKVTLTKGLGLFATSYIPLGTRILMEKPLFEIPKHRADLLYSTYHRLGAAEKQTFDGLYASVRAMIQYSRIMGINFSDLAFMGDDPTVLAKFFTNSIETTRTGLGVFATTSRVNHSCTPNVYYRYNGVLGKLTVHATQNIQRGTELCASYMGDYSNFMPREQRANTLRRHGIECKCSACTDTTGASDWHRVRMRDLLTSLHRFGTPAAMHGYDVPHNDEEALYRTKQLIDFMRLERVYSPELCRAYLRASSFEMRLNRLSPALNDAKAADLVEWNLQGPPCNQNSGLKTRSWLRYVESAGREKMGHEEMGREETGREETRREGIRGEETGGRRRGGRGKGAKGQGAKGQGAKGQGAKGQGAKGQGAMGQGAMGQWAVSVGGGNEVHSSLSRSDNAEHDGDHQNSDPQWKSRASVIQIGGKAMVLLKRGFEGHTVASTPSSVGKCAELFLCLKFSTDTIDQHRTT